MKTKRARIFNRSSPLRNRRRDILSWKLDDDEDREVRQIYAEAAAEERFKMFLKEIRREEARREKEKTERATEETNRLFVMFLLMDDNSVDTDNLQTQLDKIDVVRRSDAATRCQLRVARRIAHELLDEVEGQSGAERARERIERRLTDVNAQIDALPPPPPQQQAHLEHLEYAA